MRKFILLVFLLNVSLMMSAQNGNITPDVLSQIKKAYKNDVHNKVVTNALTNNAIKDLALNRENLIGTDHYFKYRVKVSGITDQESSGRCWMFTSLNMFRPKVIEKYNLSEFEFSENYLFFYDQLEKANLFMEAVIKHSKEPLDNKYNEWLFKSPIGDGGVWNSFSNLVVKYGLVPKEVMPETKSSSSTGWMRRLLTRKLRENALALRSMIANKESAKTVQIKKTEMLGEIYKMLAYNLGEPPVKFNYRYKNKDKEISAYKEYTPLSFMKEVLNDINFDDYILLMNDPTREYYKLFEIEYDRNVLEGKNWKYINLPNEDLKKIALESIKNDEAMYASCDVGKQLNKDNGILDINNYDFESLYGVKFGMKKADRIRSFDSGSSHGMALVAVDVDENEVPYKWQFENSWGASSGHKGYLTFTDEWFNDYMFRIVVKKEFIEEKVLKVLDQKPTLLPPWDPMFNQDI